MQTRHSVLTGQYPVTHIYQPGVNDLRHPTHVSSHPFLPHSTYNDYYQRPFNSNAVQHSATMHQAGFYRSPKQTVYGQRSPEFSKIQESHRVSSTSVPRKIPFEEVKRRYEEKDFGASGIPVFYHSPPPNDFLPLNTLNNRQFEGKLPEYRQSQIDQRFPPSNSYNPNRYQNHFVPSNLIKPHCNPSRPHRYHFLPPQMSDNQHVHNHHDSPYQKNNQNSQIHIQREKSVRQSVINQKINFDLEQQRIFCVVCRQEYSILDQENHKQAHRKRFEQSTSFQPIKDCSTIKQKIDLRQSQKNQRNKLSSKILSNYENSEQQRRRIQQSRLSHMNSSKISQKQYLKQKDGRIVSYKQDGVGTTGQLTFSFPIKQKEFSVFYNQPVQKQNMGLAQQRVERESSKPIETSFVITPQNQPIRNTAPVQRFQTIVERQEEQQFQSERKLYPEQRNKQPQSYSIRLHQPRSSEEIVSPTKISQFNQPRQSQKKLQPIEKIQYEEPIKISQPILPAVPLRQTINIQNYDQIYASGLKSGTKSMQMKRKMKPNSPIQEKSLYEAQPVQSVLRNSRPRQEPIVVNYDTVTESMTPSAYRSGQMRRKIKQTQAVFSKAEPIQPYEQPVSFGEKVERKQQESNDHIPKAHESQRFQRDSFNPDEQYESPKKYNQEVIKQRETFAVPQQNIIFHQQPEHHQTYNESKPNSNALQERPQEPECIEFDKIIADNNPQYERKKTNQNQRSDEMIPVVNQHDRNQQSERKFQQFYNSNKQTPQNSDRDFRQSNLSNQNNAEGQLPIFQSRKSAAKPDKNIKKKKIARNAMLAWD